MRLKIRLCESATYKTRMNQNNRMTKEREREALYKINVPILLKKRLQFPSVSWDTISSFQKY